MIFLYRVSVVVFGVVDSDFEDIFYVLDCWLHTSLYLFVLIMCNKISGESKCFSKYDF